MQTKTIISKQWALSARDWLVAVIQAVVVGVATFSLDKIGVDGIKFDLKEIGAVALFVFLQHVARKLGEPSKYITIKPLQDTNPPPVGDPTHPPKK